MTVYDFSIEHQMVAKRDQLDELVARHNYLTTMVPKVLTQDVVPEMQLALAEIDVNMKQLLTVMGELEELCKMSQF